MPAMEPWSPASLPMSMEPWSPASLPMSMEPWDDMPLLPPIADMSCGSLITKEILADEAVPSMFATSSVAIPVSSNVAVMRSPPSGASRPASDSTTSPPSDSLTSYVAPGICSSEPSWRISRDRVSSFPGCSMPAGSADTRTS